MHVTTREIKRWAWQSFWWNADPDQAVFPTTSGIIQQRPEDLKNGRGHYAMTLAYQMIFPAQPMTGGQNIGTSLYAYNPYLESGFGHAVFQETSALLAPDFKSLQTNNLGVQTNCMTCHRLAMYNPRINYSAKTNVTLSQYPYSADFYIDENDSVFNGSLKLDFAWSILGNLVPEPSVQEQQ